MCALRDSMREVRAAAECLSAACRAGTDPRIQPMLDVYAGDTAVPIPADMLDALERIDAVTTH